MIYPDNFEQKIGFNEILILRITKTEKNRIYEKMYGMGIRSLSAYIRKMALDGYCLNLDLPQLRRMSYLLQNCSNNLNQVAKRVNESNQLYAADIEDLRHRPDTLPDIVRFPAHCRSHPAEDTASMLLRRPPEES